MGLETAFEAADLFGLTELSRRALSDRPNPKDLGLIVPAKLADIPRPARATARFDPEALRELAHKLERGLTPLAPHVAVLDSVRALATPGATCVVAGQQPGLFGGPLFNCYKALHVARLARELQAQWGTPVIPVLWNHADDHDIAEAHHAWWINPHVDLVKLTLPGASSGRRPLGRFVCDDKVHQLPALSARLADLLAGEPFGDEVLALAMPRAGETLARAWTRFHLELFGHLGVVVVEPDWVRAELSEALADLVAPHPGPALAAGAKRLADANLSVAIDPAEAALVYHVVNDERLALRTGGDGWRYDDEPGSRTPAELAAEIVTDKAHYDAGALLRPLTQDLTLPVAAYVGGHGELGYHAELAELRHERGLDPTVFVPRLSCTLTDARCRSSLRRSNLAVGDFLRAPAVSVEELEAPGSQVAARIRAAGEALHRALLQERPHIGTRDVGLPAQLRRTANQVKRQVEGLAENLEHSATNHAGAGRRHHRRLTAMLWPREQPQERVLTTAQMVARLGRDWIDQLFEVLEPLPVEHVLAHIDPHEDPGGDPNGETPG